MPKKNPERRFARPMQIRVTLEQLALFRQAAKADGRTLSNWARERLEKSAAKEVKPK